MVLASFALPPLSAQGDPALPAKRCLFAETTGDSQTRRLIFAVASSPTYASDLTIALKGIKVRCVLYATLACTRTYKADARSARTDATVGVRFQPSYSSVFSSDSLLEDTNF